MVILAKVVDLLKLPYQLPGLAWFFFDISSLLHSKDGDSEVFPLNTCAVTMQGRFVYLMGTSSRTSGVCLVGFPDVFDPSNNTSQKVTKTRSKLPLTAVETRQGPENYGRLVVATPRVRIARQRVGDASLRHQDTTWLKLSVVFPNKHCFAVALPLTFEETVFLQVETIRVDMVALAGFQQKR